jgi:hypothetical protein
MTLRERYWEVLQRSTVVGPSLVATLPQALTLACVEVVPVAGAGLSLTGQLRVPLSASSQHVAEAERLQTSLGEGPCLTAAAVGHPVAANADQLSRRWPVYAMQLRQRTAFRSVASLPLLWWEGAAFGALDLYSTEPSGSFDNLDEIHASVSPAISAALTGQHDWFFTLPDHLATDLAARRRTTVWTAIGMVMGTTALDYDDALALLRGHAFRHDLDLDEVARQVVERSVTTNELVDLA